MSSTGDDEDAERAGGPDPDRRPRRPRRRVVLTWAAVVVLAWLGFAAFQTYSAATSARDGVDAMEALRGTATEDIATLLDSVGGETDDVAEEDAAGQLAAAADAFGDAHGRLSSFVLRPLWYAPVLGRQLRSADALSSAAETTAASASVAVAELADVLSSSSASGDTRLLGVQRSEQALSTFRTEVSDLDLGPAEGLVGPLANARGRFEQEYGDVTETLEEMTAALAGVNEFLTGPSDYLLLAANNAEMRAGSGMYLQVGPIQVSDGTFDVQEFSATDGLVLDEPATTVDSDIEQLWGTLSPARDWRNTNLSPRFDETARTAAAMWTASGGSPVEGVVSIDVVALARLLEVTGPVELPTGEQVSVENVVEDLLVEQYRTFGEDRDARRERLGQVARAVFDAINERPLSAGDLLRVLQEMGAGRHVLMWSSNELEQEAWRALGTDGIPASDSMMLSVLNRGGNKLDPFLVITSTVNSEIRGDLRHVQVDIWIRNDAPADLPPYVAGPHPGTGLTDGEYKGLVTLTMPSGAGNVAIDGGVPSVIGPDGPTRVAATEVTLERGTSTGVRFEFDLPTAWESLAVLPGARLPSTTWNAGNTSWTDDAVHEIRFDQLG